MLMTQALHEDFLSSEELDHYTAAFEGWDRMRAGFELYRAFGQDAKDVRASVEKEGKMKMPVLSLGGEGSAFTPVSRLASILDWLDVWLGSSRLAPPRLPPSLACYPIFSSGAISSSSIDVRVAADDSTLKE